MRAEVSRGWRAVWCPCSQRNWPFPGLPGTGNSTSQLPTEKANNRVTDSPKCESTRMTHPATGSFPIKWWEFFFFWWAEVPKGKAQEGKNQQHLCKCRNNSALFFNKRKEDALPHLPAFLHCVFQQVQSDINRQEKQEGLFQGEHEAGVGTGRQE